LNGLEEDRQSGIPWVVFICTQTREHTRLRLIKSIQFIQYISPFVRFIKMQNEKVIWEKRFSKNEEFKDLIFNIDIFLKNFRTGVFIILPPGSAEYAMYEKCSERLKHVLQNFQPQLKFFFVSKQTCIYTNQKYYKTYSVFNNIIFCVYQPIISDGIVKKPSGVICDMNFFDGEIFLSPSHKNVLFVYLCQIKTILCLRLQLDDDLYSDFSVCKIIPNADMEIRKALEDGTYNENIETLPDVNLENYMDYWWSDNHSRVGDWANGLKHGIQLNWIY